MRDLPISLRLPPGTVLVHARHSHTRQKLLGVFPWRRYITLEIIGRGWTQVRHRGEIAPTVTEWLKDNNEDTTQELLVLWV